MVPQSTADLTAALEEVIAETELMRDQLYMSGRILRLAKQRIIDLDCERRTLEARVAWLEQRGIHA